MSTVSLNDIVRFTITQDGIDHLAKLDAELRIKPGTHLEALRFDRRTNRCECPLWEVMNLFGVLLTMGSCLKPIANNHLHFVAA